MKQFRTIVGISIFILAFALLFISVWGSILWTLVGFLIYPLKSRNRIPKVLRVFMLIMFLPIAFIVSIVGSAYELNEKDIKEKKAYSDYLTERNLNE